MLKHAAETKSTGNYVLETVNHTRILYSNFNRAYCKMKQSTGINKTIHCFRHTFATKLLSKGIPIMEVSRILGHKKASVTLNVYGHSIPSYNKKIIEQLQKKKKI